jgi:hypothetical protein
MSPDPIRPGDRVHDRDDPDPFDPRESYYEYCDCHQRVTASDYTGTRPVRICSPYICGTYVMSMLATVIFTRLQLV